MIAGSGFTGATDVLIGASDLMACPATPSCFTFVSGNEIDLVTPPGVAGTFDVQVVTPGGTSPVSPADQYTYLDPPTVASVATPQVQGAAEIAVTGTNFSIPGPPIANAVSEVDLVPTTTATGPTLALTTNPCPPGAADCFTFTDDSDLTINVPTSMAAGQYDTQVITAGGTSVTSAKDLLLVQQPVPTVTTVTPNAGPESGGPPAVTIDGANFGGSGFTTTGVSFGGTSVAFSPISASSITATPPSGTGQVDITVTTVSTDGSSTQTSATTNADTYAYAPIPSVTNVSPGTGPTGGGNTVTLTGTGFMSKNGPGANYATTQVTVDTTPVSTICSGTPTSPCFSVTDATHIAVENFPPDSAGTVDITVSTPGGTSATSSGDQYTYALLPTVTGVSPGAGPASGGNPVTVSGTGFTGTTLVVVGSNDINTPCPGSPCFTVNSPTQITVPSLPAHAPTTVDITVQTPAGTSTTSAADQYIYASAPTVTSVSPAFGPLVGGNSVTVNGAGFAPAGVLATEVSVGGSRITEPCPGSPCFTVASDSQITIENLPPGSAATVDVTVTGVGGTSSTSSADQYTYVPPPSVSGVAPSTGPTGGGNTVVISGSTFESGAEFTSTSVKVDTHNITVSPCPPTPSAPCFTVNSAIQLTIGYMPAHVVGTVDIIVTTAEGTSTAQASDQYAYAPIPTVSGVSPNAGVAAGGNTVTVTGTLLAGATEVSVGATNITVSPCPGPPSAPCFNDVSATQITIEDFPSGSGNVDITVTTPGGTSPATTVDVYAYAPFPTITKVAPTHGSINGGTSVTITGTGFEPTGTNRNFTTTVVSVGSVAVVMTPCPGAPTAPCYNVNSATQLFMEDFPAHAAGPVDITATTIGGTSALSGADKFFYGATFPTVTFLSQKYGAEKGGAVLTITGTNFSSTGGITVSDVFFGSTDVPASNAFPCVGSAGCFTVVGPSQITAYAPAASTAGAVDVTVTTNIGTSGTSAADRYTYIAAGAYTALSPFRICDTRASRSPDECTGKIMGSRGKLTVQITGLAGPSGQMVPAGAEAVVVNLTAINHSSTITLVTAYPAGSLSVPSASTMNLDPDAVQSNLGIVQLSSGGAITLFNAAGSLDAIVDVQGYFAAPPGSGPIAGEFHSITPIRMCDTRANHGTVCAGATNQPLLARTWRKVVLSGTGSIPATGASAAVFNLTATQGTLATFLAVQPPNASDLCPTGSPGSSNLNPKAGGSLPNRVISPLGPANDICVYNAVGSIEFIVDVDGWFGNGSESPPGTLFYSVPPTRICDTRTGTGTRCSGHTLFANAKEVVQIAGVTAVPAFLGAQPAAVVANLTGVAGTQSTYLELFPSDDLHQPNASDLNPVAHDVIANLAIVGLAQTAGATQGDVSLYNSVGDINAILDVAGWFQ